MKFHARTAKHLLDALQLCIDIHGEDILVGACDGFIVPEECVSNGIILVKGFTDGSTDFTENNLGLHNKPVLKIQSSF